MKILEEAKAGDVLVIPSGWGSEKVLAVVVSTTKTLVRTKNVTYNRDGRVAGSTERFNRGYVRLATQQDMLDHHVVQAGRRLAKVVVTVGNLNAVLEFLNSMEAK